MERFFIRRLGRRQHQIKSHDWELPLTFQLLFLATNSWQLLCLILKVAAGTIDDLVKD